MNAPSKIFVSLEHVIICLECFTVSAMMVMNWTEQEGTVQVWPVQGFLMFLLVEINSCAKYKNSSNFCLAFCLLDCCALGFMVFKKENYTF